MRLTDADLRQLHAEMTAHPDRSGCLGEDLILRAGEGRLGAAEKKSVADHLARCSDCAREYRVAVAMRPLMEKSGRRRSVFALAAAAVVLLLLLPLIWLALHRQRDTALIATLQKKLEDRRPVPAPPAPGVADLVRPNLDTPIVDLDTDVVRGEGAGIPTIVVPQSADVFTTLLHLDEEIRGTIELSIEGPAAWSGTWTAREPTAVVTMTLHRRRFPAGDYVVRARSGTRTASFRFRVEYR